MRLVRIKRKAHLLLISFLKILITVYTRMSVKLKLGRKTMMIKRKTRLFTKICRIYKATLINLHVINLYQNILWLVICILGKKILSQIYYSKGSSNLETYTALSCSHSNLQLLKIFQ